MDLPFKSITTIPDRNIPENSFLIVFNPLPPPPLSPPLQCWIWQNSPFSTLYLNTEIGGGENHELSGNFCSRLQFLCDGLLLISTVWKVYKCKYKKIRTRKNSVCGQFSRSVGQPWNGWENFQLIVNIFTNQKRFFITCKYFQSSFRKMFTETKAFSQVVTLAKETRNRGKTPCNILH